MKKIYVSRHPDVAANSLSPAEHLIRLGCFEGRKEAISRALVSNLLSMIDRPFDQPTTEACQVQSMRSVNPLDYSARNCRL